MAKSFEDVRGETGVPGRLLALGEAASGRTGQGSAPSVSPLSVLPTFHIKRQELALLRFLLDACSLPPASSLDMRRQMPAPKVELLHFTATLHSPLGLDQVCRVAVRSCRLLKEKPQHTPPLICQHPTTKSSRGGMAAETPDNPKWPNHDSLAPDT